MTTHLTANTSKDCVFEICGDSFFFLMLMDPHPTDPEL